MSLGETRVCEEFAFLPQHFRVSFSHSGYHESKRSRHDDHISMYISIKYVYNAEG